MADSRTWPGPGEPGGGLKIRPEIARCLSNWPTHGRATHGTMPEGSAGKKLPTRFRLMQEAKRCVQRVHRPVQWLSVALSVFEKKCNAPLKTCVRCPIFNLKRILAQPTLWCKLSKKVLLDQSKKGDRSTMAEQFYCNTLVCFF